MKVLSLFSGVGGFDMGLENAGMETVFQCEWDKHCRTILDRHWPTVPKWDDVSTLTGEHILAHAPVIDVVAWGSPCQDLSVAGKRAGLEGGRSGLFYEGMRIINELRKASNGKYPRISIWENVYGALNSNKGEDFEAILKEMVEAGSLLCEWRVLDAQYFGVPQRRRRVFVVAVFDSATAARCPDPLLPVSEGLRWNPTTRTATREESADTVTASIGSGSEWWDGGQIANALTTTSNEQRMPDKDRLQAVVVGTLTVSDLTKQVNNEIISEGLLQVVEPYTSSSFAQYEQGVGTLRSNGGDLGGGSETLLLDGTRVDDVQVYESPVQTLKERMGTGGNNVPMVAFSHTQGLDAQPSESAWPTLRKEGNGHAVAIPIQDGREMEKNQNGLGVAEEGAPAYTIDQTGAQAVAYPIHPQAVSSGGNSRPNSDGRGNGLGIGKEGDPSTAVVGTTPPAVAAGTSTMVVRRLTPLECERLMGWPDNHTRYKADGTEQADTHRYKQCGNGVASPVAQWIGEQLVNL
ncbi:MAG: DNA (cytosine-5-)-methyltransferase [Caulobacteraceae bacterium]|nr:DNA (cytosine-5-)-methyltransferase [Caulobacteraceae bacterium]